MSFREYLQEAKNYFKSANELPGDTEGWFKKKTDFKEIFKLLSKDDLKMLVDYHDNGNWWKMSNSDNYRTFIRDTPEFKKWFKKLSDDALKLA